jgi:hypothetical protein
MVPLSVGIAWYHEGWFAALIALVGGFVLAFFLTNLLRQYVQVLWAVSMIVVLAWITIATAARLVG